MSLINTSHDGNTYPVRGAIRRRVFKFTSRNQNPKIEDLQQPPVAALPSYREAHIEAARLERQWHREPSD